MALVDAKDELAVRGLYKARASVATVDATKVVGCDLDIYGGAFHERRLG
jgi:hypothetical protein